ncbi:site-specific DNA-methyltransferase [Streptomyces fulvoviolaceus]|uniref:site-specific DNA-methyltransferase n=1 Tax=Streptomyces fulvoviolaceus TaxID=285535 RepID=UPI0021C11494|nr:site-specific DNA-methyltransferase [Streptomyces fulvoviolaceus]MCT9084463.1 site-specific DNA-methyltransferase [Streptomyces fulvoviolaceus]
MPDTVQDRARIHPAVAVHAITNYTRPGDTVLDPQCGAGTVLVEALRSDRHAVGITEMPRWWPVARANVTAAKRDGATTDGMVLDGPLDRATARLSGLTGCVGLVLTPLRLEGPPRRRTADSGFDPDCARRSVKRLQGILKQSLPLLRPGGHVIVIVRLSRHRGYLLNLADDVLVTGRAVGLSPAERCIALLAELRGDRLVLTASMAQRRHDARHQRSTGHPAVLTAHHDVLIFRASYPAVPRAANHRPPGKDRQERLSLLPDPQDRVLEGHAA